MQQNSPGAVWGSEAVTCGYVVGDTGIEPVTSSVSGKRATAAPIALTEFFGSDVPLGTQFNLL